jgi:hypothetical protein
MLLCGCSGPSDGQLDRTFDSSSQKLELLIVAFRDNPKLHVLWLDGTNPPNVDIDALQLQDYRAAMKAIGAFRVDGHKTELRVLLDSRGSPASDLDCNTGFLYKADRLSSEAPPVESLRRGQRFTYFKSHLVALGSGWYRFRSASCDGAA